MQKQVRLHSGGLIIVPCMQGCRTIWCDILAYDDDSSPGKRHLLTFKGMQSAKIIVILILILL